jgi:hypothetical protein
MEILQEAEEDVLADMAFHGSIGDRSVRRPPLSGSIERLPGESMWWAFSQTEMP